MPGRTPGTAAALDVTRAVVERSLRLGPQAPIHGVHLEVETIDVDTGVSVLSIYAAVPLGTEAATTAEFLSRLANLDTGVSDDILAAARADATLDFAMGFTSSASAAAALQRWALAGRDAAELDAFPGQLAAVGASDVAATLKRCRGHEVISLVGPMAGGSLEGLDARTRTIDWRAEMARIVQDLN